VRGWNWRLGKNGEALGCAAAARELLRRLPLEPLGLRPCSGSYFWAGLQFITATFRGPVPWVVLLPSGAAACGVAVDEARESSGLAAWPWSDLGAVARGNLLYRGLDRFNSSSLLGALYPPSCRRDPSIRRAFVVELRVESPLWTDVLLISLSGLPTPQRWCVSLLTSIPYREWRTADPQPGDQLEPIRKSWLPPALPTCTGPPRLQGSLGWEVSL
jgi:hypothetical protein